MDDLISAEALFDISHNFVPSGSSRPIALLGLSAAREGLSTGCSKPRTTAQRAKARKSASKHTEIVDHDRSQSRWRDRTYFGSLVMSSSVRCCTCSAVSAVPCQSTASPFALMQ